MDEYLDLFRIMQAAPANAQNSETPFKDVVDLATAIARARGLDAANADVAGRIALGIFFAETNGNRIHRQCAFQQVQGETIKPACLKVKAAKAGGRQSSRRLRLLIRR